MTSVHFLAVMELAVANREAADDGFLLAAGRTRLRDRCVARLRAHQLDRALAGGVRSETTQALALRARRLTSMRFRGTITESYLQILRRARGDQRPSYARVPPNRTQVNGASHELARLAKALAQPGPVGARGVAQAVLLLRDGTGPLYNGGGQPCLREYLTIATQNLELVPGGTISAALAMSPRC